MAGRSRAEIAVLLKAAVRDLYARKEAEFPVQIAMNRFLGERSQSQPAQYDREGLAAWFTQRFDTLVDPDELRPLLRPEIDKTLRELARKHYKGGHLWSELGERLDSVYGPVGNSTATPAAASGASLAAWARDELGVEISPDEMVAISREDLRSRLADALDARYRPEMREMEKVVVLNILDSGWMEHLRGMDHLRSSVGLRGYGQVDPKVEYKREGMKIFEEMWVGLGDKVTDLVFRMEQLDPEFLNYLGSRWQLDRAKAIHQSAEVEQATVATSAGGGSIRQQQEAGISASQKSERRPEPVRNTGRKVGRNDPCPCGSGRKYKVCCMKKTPGDEIL